MRKKRQLLQLQIDSPPIVMAERDLHPEWGGARRGAGRPRKAIATKTISLRVDAAMYACMEKAAERVGIKLSNWAKAVLYTEAMKHPQKF